MGSLMLLLMVSLPAHACGGCVMGGAYFWLPWLYTWLKICLAWWLLGFFLRGRSRDGGEHMNSALLGIGSIVAGGIMLGPIPAFLAILLWLREYLWGWIQILGRRLEPGKRPYFFASHAFWAALLVSALLFLKQDAEQGPQGPLSRVRAAHGAVAGSVLKWAESKNLGISELEEFYHSPLPEVRLGSMVLARGLLLSGKLQDLDRLEALATRAKGDKDDKVASAAETCLRELDKRRRPPK